MKLTLGHNDIIAGICMLLESKGMTAFSPEVVQASFSQSRKDGTLSVELDNEPAPKEDTDKPAKAPAEAKPKAAAQASATKGGENNAPEAEANGGVTKQIPAEEKAPSETQAAVENATAEGGAKADETGTAPAQTQAAQTSDETDNLFG